MWTLEFRIKDRLERELLLHKSIVIFCGNLIKKQYKDMKINK